VRADHRYQPALRSVKVQLQAEAQRQKLLNFDYAEDARY
jgi:hypothetical protein